jgi:hypothetical protein
MNGGFERINWPDNPRCISYDIELESWISHDRRTSEFMRSCMVGLPQSAQSVAANMFEGDTEVGGRLSIESHSKFSEISTIHRSVALCSHAAERPLRHIKSFFGDDTLSKANKIESFFRFRLCLMLFGANPKGRHQGSRHGSLTCCQDCTSFPDHVPVPFDPFRNFSSGRTDKWMWCLGRQMQRVAFLLDENAELIREKPFPTAQQSRNMVLERTAARFRLNRRARTGVEVGTSICCISAPFP